MTVSTDALGRRKRTRPQSTGKRISLQPADLVWFSKLAQHGPLPSSFLLAYTAEQRTSEKRATDRLTDLFNEDNTPHDGTYLTRPLQQFRTIDSRYKQLVYDLTPAGLRSLKDSGMADRSARPSGPWLHQCMVACVTASIELATLQTDALSFIPQGSILECADTTLRYPIVFNGRSKDLIPDALFGLEYHTEQGSRFRFFAVECDRGTEPLRSGNSHRKSFVRHLAQYRQYIAEGLYKDHLQLTAPLLVLNVTTAQDRLERMLKITKNVSGDAGNNYQLFQTWEDFGEVYRPPRPKHDLLNGKWQRAGLRSFDVTSL